MGHNLGMSHDFSKKHGGTDTPSSSSNACNDKGIMSYGSVPERWSDCSVADFKGAYKTNNWGNRCLDVQHVQATGGNLNYFDN